MLAVEELAGGPALLLDESLRVLAATDGVGQLLGERPALGASAPALLCGASPKRPVAQALSEGRAISTTIPHPSGRGELSLRVATTPLMRAGARQGWVVRLVEESARRDGPELFHGMWSADAAMKQMFRIVERVARVDASVLVRGETGAGKELVAAALHRCSPRSKGPFRAINCAAMPPALLESELFGHVRGAFTGAVRDSPGHFRAADGGTLFLDEVAELPLEVQAKLLRVLESRTVMPVGASESAAVDVRIVAATHRSLRQEVEAGRFRADLMFRLRVIPIFLPPLRERSADVILLAERVIEELNRRGGRAIARISSAAAQLLVAYDWPGNVRELRNVLEYAFATGDGPVLSEVDLPAELRSSVESSPAGRRAAEGGGPPPSGRAHRLRPERALVELALARASGRRADAAAALGISRVTLWRRMRELGIE